MDEDLIKHGGDADDFNLHWRLKGVLRSIGQAINTKQHRVLNSCCGISQSIGCDFPSCLGFNILGTCCCCIAVDLVMCKPVERHPRVEFILAQGGAYIAKPKPHPTLGYSICKGTASACCLEHRYAFPTEEAMGVYPIRCTLCGAQCCQFGPVGLQHECERRCFVHVAPLPRVKPAVAESADVIYHQTRNKADPDTGVLGSAAVKPQQQQMQRL